MQTSSYLLDLTVRLMHGASQLPVEQRTRQAEYLLGSQNADGGFSGREGGSDLYYTGFALRSLAILDVLTPAVCQRAAFFLRQNLTGQAGIIDFFSLLYASFLVGMAGEDVLAGSPADWPERVANTLEGFRTPDGGYAKAVGSPGGSVYHTFLVALSYQLLDRPLPRPDDLLKFILSRQRPDGGFVEIAPMRRSGTNPTAAALGVLQMLHTADWPVMTDSVRHAATDFLLDMRTSEGGFRGNSRIPAADLLSTFTGLWTLAQLGAFDRIDRQAVRDFTLKLEVPTSGFRAGWWDEQTDVEYTFYGLGCLALLVDSDDDH